MLQDFDIKSTLEKLREFQKLEQEHIKVTNVLNKTYASHWLKKDIRSMLEEEKSRSLVVRQKASIFSKFASFFHIGKYYRINQNIAAQEAELRAVEEECKKLEEKEKKLERYKRMLEMEKESKKMPESIREENGIIVITDKSIGDVKKEVNEIQDSSQVEAKRKVLVHCTNFFPNNNMILSNYDGGKIISGVTEYHGVQKEIHRLHHRHEVHCTINNRVKNTGAGEGNWNNPSYIIIDRYDLHENEMESTGPSDAWTKGNSIRLSDDSVIMVRIQDKDKLPIQDEELDKYNIIYYDGDATTCLRKFLRLNDYDIFHTDANSNSHARSSRMEQERGLESRNLAINFVKDNTYFSKEPPIFSASEIAQITDVGICAAVRASHIISPRQEILCCETKEIPKDKEESYSRVANFVIGTGMKKTEDGRYTFKSDEEIIEIIEALRADRDALPGFIDVDLIYEVFEMQQRLAERYAMTPLPSVEEFNSMSLQELYKFENQLACEAVQAILPGDISMISRDEHIDIRIYVVDCPEINKKIKASDGIQSVSEKTLQRSLDGTSKVGDIKNYLDEFIKKVEEIKERSVQDLTNTYEVR